ncbi:MAG: (Fe-S)-binding protein [Bacteroidia bacterium]
MLTQILFAVVSAAALGGFAWQLNRIRQSIALGRPEARHGQPVERWKKMLLVALGQQKMFAQPLPALMHFAIYAAFLLTQVELLEIFVDGFSGSHRIFRPALGGFYTFVISLIEVLSLLALVATFAFLARRNLLKVPRLSMSELNGWPKLDGNLILYGEIVLVVCIFMMNGADEVLYTRGASHAAGAEGVSGSFGFALSQWIGPLLFGGIESPDTLHLLERIGWWGHILVVFSFLNYLPVSKHFHIIMAFPNTYFSNLKPSGAFTSPAHIQEEIKAILDPGYTPAEVPDAPKRFGARDVNDLSWKSLMDAYTCTECGRCTSMCPANLTGKKLSPRKIVMDVRDRLEEVQRYGLVVGEDGNLTPGRQIAGAEEAATRHLLGDPYITEEELRACTTCNACTEACPVNIDPLSIIVELRRYLVMEESSMPEAWGAMHNNIENNGAPWPMPAADRFNWADEL